MKYFSVVICMLFNIFFSASLCLSVGPYMNKGDTVDDQATCLTWMRKTADINNNGLISVDDTLS